MPKTSMSYLPIFLLFFFSLLTSSSSSSHADAAALLVSPITKDHSTRQYTLTISLKTPPQPTTLLLDLGASFSWLDCTLNYTSSSSYRPIPCSTPLCTSLHSLSCSNCFHPPGPGCSNDSCSMFPENSVTHTAIAAQDLQDSLSLPTATHPTQLVTLPDFVFSCSTTSLLQGLAKGVSGLAGLGRSNISLPAQLSVVLSEPYVFALCLSGSRKAAGVALFNSRGPYYFSGREIDLASTLIYTPLILNPIGSTIITYYLHPSDEYFIGVTSIKVNGKDVQLNKTLLSIDENGFGGTKISTVVPYTVLETSLYKAFTDAFVKESAALNLTVTTTAVKPFSVCYAAREVTSTRVGPAVPTIDLVMQSDDVFWRVFGANSMVRVARKDADVWCLGFVDGGVNPRASIVIGGSQMEDNLLQFDVGLKRFGFSSSVLVHGTTCANFNVGQM